MTKYVIALTLWSYFLGPWEIGPFTDYKSCENLRQYQLAWGVKDVGTCAVVTDRWTYELAPPTYGAPLDTDEYARREGVK